MQAGDDTHTEHERTTISGRDARQGEIILRTKPRRAIFIIGLAGMVLLVFVISAIAYR